MKLAVKCSIALLMIVALAGCNTRHTEFDYGYTVIPKDTINGTPTYTVNAWVKARQADPGGRPDNCPVIKTDRMVTSLEEARAIYDQAVKLYNDTKPEGCATVPLDDPELSAAN